MSLAFCAAPINNDNSNENINNNINNKGNKDVNRRSKNTTYKNNNTTKIKKEMISDILNDYSDDDDNDKENNDITNNLGNFTSIKSDTQSIDTNYPVQPNPLNNQLNNLSHMDDNNGNMMMENMVSNQNEYASLDNAYDNAMQQNYSSNSELLRKLDSILHLLEEQQEDKTNYITEELILYVFLGVFIIYVLDSFVRIGKYVR